MIRNDAINVLNMHFSPVFTEVETSNLHIPRTKFNGLKTEMLGQLFVTIQ